MCSVLLYKDKYLFKSIAMKAIRDSTRQNIPSRRSSHLDEYQKWCKYSYILHSRDKEREREERKERRRTNFPCAALITTINVNHPPPKVTAPIHETGARTPSPFGPAMHAIKGPRDRMVTNGPQQMHLLIATLWLGRNARPIILLPFPAPKIILFENDRIVLASNDLLLEEI